MRISVYEFVGEAKSFEAQLSGVVLLVISLSCDAVTGPLQELVQARHKHTPMQLMFANNIYACAALVLAVTILHDNISAVVC